jgi:hypothetical protein
MWEVLKEVGVRPESSPGSIDQRLTALLVVELRQMRSVVAPEQVPIGTMTDEVEKLLREAHDLLVAEQYGPHHQLIKRINACLSRLDAERAALPEGWRYETASIDRLRNTIVQMEKDHQEDLRQAAAQARHSERFPDEPAGTY